MDILAIIPARGGSKSIPRKNIRSFAGHPLIAYSIAAGLQSRLVTRTIVSTDDDEIAAVARQYGAETPFMRPAEFAQDTTTDFPVFTHALRWLAEVEGYHPEIVVQLRPTSPIRPPEMVDSAITLLLENPGADSARGVVPSGQNPHKMWRIAADGRMLPLLEVPGIAEPYNAPRQALPPTYWQTGHIDAIRAACILEKGSLSGAVILPLLIDPKYTIDIDTLRDLERAEWMAQSGELPMVRPPSPPTPRPLGEGPGVGGKRPLPRRVSLVIFDFDGVMTDDQAWVDQDGREMVRVHRGDGMGVSLLRKAGVEMFILSTEPNPVVSARARKLNIPVQQGVNDKAAALLALLAERGVAPAEVVYLGNDVNDIPCFPLVACAAVPADAHPQALALADVVLERKGGRGAVRELCDRLLKRQP